MKILSARLHGLIDYAVVLLFLLAPTLFGFGGTPQIACYVVAAVHLTMSLLTAYPLGIAKLIPFPLHGRIEMVVVPALVVLPWLLGFSEVLAARNFFLAAAAAIAVVVFLTNYNAAEAAAQAHPARA